MKYYLRKLKIILLPKWQQLVNFKRSRLLEKIVLQKRAAYPESALKMYKINLISIAIIP